MRDVVAQKFEGVARECAQEFAPQVVGKVPQNEVAIAFDGNAAQAALAVGRKVDAPELALVDEIVDVPLRAPEFCRHFSDRQRRPVDEIHREKGEFKLSGVAHFWLIVFKIGLTVFGMDTVKVLNEVLFILDEEHRRFAPYNILPSELRRPTLGEAIDASLDFWVSLADSIDFECANFAVHRRWGDLQGWSPEMRFLTYQRVNQALELVSLYLRCLKDEYNPFVFREDLTATMLLMHTLVDVHEENKFWQMSDLKSFLPAGLLAYKRPLRRQDSGTILN